VFDTIERFYDAVRRHSTIGDISPVGFEKMVGLAELGVHGTGFGSCDVRHSLGHRDQPS
jgi:hypothetical protein